MRGPLWVWGLAAGLAAGAGLFACGSSGSGAASQDAGPEGGADGSPAEGGGDAPSDTSATDAAGADGETSAPGACTVGGNACGKDEYCAASDATCTKGVCARVSLGDTSDLSPVCGCNGITYWNPNNAARAGAATKGTGACTTGAKTCGGIAGLRCPAPTLCNYEVSDGFACNVVDFAGVCWGLPGFCPLLGQGSRVCDTGKCTRACDAIRAQERYHRDVSCP